MTKPKWTNRTSTQLLGKYGLGQELWLAFYSWAEIQHSKGVSFEFLMKCEADLERTWLDASGAAKISA